MMDIVQILQDKLDELFKKADTLTVEEARIECFTSDKFTSPIEANLLLKDHSTGSKMAALYMCRYLIMMYNYSTLLVYNRRLQEVQSKKTSTKKKHVNKFTNIPE